MKTMITIIALASGSVLGVPAYTVHDLGLLGLEAEAHAINDAGVAVGLSYDTIAAHLAVRFEPGGPVPLLGPIAFEQSESVDINDAGLIAAMAFTLGELTSHGYITDGSLPPLDIGAFIPRAIDEQGRLVGARPVLTADSVYRERAAWWNGATRIDLPSLSGADWSIAHDIDAAGRIVGAVTPAGAIRPKAVLWDGPIVTDLGSLGGQSAQALGMNDLGDIVGVSDTPSGAPHAFLFHVSGASVTERIDLGVIAGNDSAACAVNASRQVVGASNGRAFLWQDGAIHDLNTLVADLDGWDLQSAMSINDAGVIVGHGTHKPFGRRAFMLVPANDCPADLAEPFGVLDLADVTAFIVAFLAHDPLADLAEPFGVFDLGDVTAFVQSFLAGCP